MVYQPAVNVAQVTMQYSNADGQVNENVYHVLNTGAWSAGQLSSLVAAFIGWENQTISGTQPNTNRSSAVSLINVIARDLTTAGGLEFSSSGGLPVAGTLAAPWLPNGCTIALKAGTGLAGRSFRGRSFWIGLAVSEMAAGDNNLISSAYATKLLICMANLGALVTAANAAWGLCVLSRTANGAKRAAGVATLIKNWSLVDGYTDYQRRRAPAHNRHS